jgi:hypothetical protein
MCSGRVGNSGSTSDIRRISRYNPGDLSWMKKVPDCNYDNRHVSVVICDIDIP